MLRYILKRLLLMIPILLGINLLIFTIMYLSPSDPAILNLGQNATPEAIEQWHEEHGLNKSFVEQYINSVVNFVKGDFGSSYVSNRSVIAEFQARFPITLTFAVTGMFLAILIGIPIGVISAVKQYSLFEYVGIV